MVQFVARYSKRQEACVPCAQSGHSTRSTPARQAPVRSQVWYSHSPSNFHVSNTQSECRSLEQIQVCQSSPHGQRISRQRLTTQNVVLFLIARPVVYSRHQVSAPLTCYAFSGHIATLVVIQSVNIINTTEYLIAAAVTTAVSWIIRKVGQWSARYKFFFGSYCNFPIP